MIMKLKDKINKFIFIYKKITYEMCCINAFLFTIINSIIIFNFLECKANATVLQSIAYFVLVITFAIIVTFIQYFIYLIIKEINIYVTSILYKYKKYSNEYESQRNKHKIKEEIYHD